MGLDPVRFLVVTRILAARADGAAADAVRRPDRRPGRRADDDQSFNIPIVTFLQRSRQPGRRQGLACRAGQDAGVRDPDRRHRLPARAADADAGRSAVGISATRAVVSGIVLLVVVDGIYAFIYYLLDI